MTTTERDGSAPVTFFELVRQRRSCRSYRDEPVSDEHIAAMLEAARLAPSACNKQPWRFAVVRPLELRQRLVEEALLPGLGMKWALDAPVIIALGLKKSLITHQVASRISGVEYAALDLGIAGEHLVLQAAEFGLGTCWIGWVKPKAVARIVGWSRDIHARALITVGWPMEPPGKPRPRCDIEDIANWPSS